MTLLPPRRSPRPDVPQPRMLAGVALGATGRHLHAALVAVEGHGLRGKPRLLAATTSRVPQPVRRMFRQLRRGRCRRPVEAALLAARLAELQAVLCESLASQNPAAWDQLLAIGVQDPGLWIRSPHELTGYLGLCDAARLADLTGANVIDAFPARDIAQDGRGEPLTCLPAWMLLHHAQRSRVLVELSRDIRLTLLPAGSASNPAAGVLRWPIPAGMRLVNRLARLLDGASPYDSDRHATVQGQQIPELLDQWRATVSTAGIAIPSPGEAASRSRPRLAALLEAVQTDWSACDVLATATHFVADLVAHSVYERVPPTCRAEEVVLVGNGQRNALLVRGISARLDGHTIVRAEQLGWPDPALAGAMAAILAALYVDQVPANSTALTGAQVPRVLGRLTAGSPQSWNRLLRTMYDQRPVMTLRSAV